MGTLRGARPEGPWYREQARFHLTLEPSRLSDLFLGGRLGDRDLVQFDGLIALLVALPPDDGQRFGDMAWPQFGELDLADRGDPVLLDVAPVVDHRAVPKAPDLFLQNEPPLEPFGKSQFVVARLDAFTVLARHLGSSLSGILAGGEPAFLDLATIDGRPWAFLLEGRYRTLRGGKEPVGVFENRPGGPVTPFQPATYGVLAALWPSAGAPLVVAA